MAIKVNFADAFLQSYGPGAQQGAAQWQALQRQKAQEQQFQIERADALAQYQQKQDLQNRELAGQEEYRRGILANQNADNARQQSVLDNQQADVQTAAKGMQSLAAGVPNPRQQIADVAGMFKTQGPQEAFVKSETEALEKRERQEASGKLSLAIREAKAKPEIAGDAVLGGQLELAEQIAMDPKADPIQLLKEVTDIYKQAGERQTNITHQVEYQSRLEAKTIRLKAVADALDDHGEYDKAQEIYDQIEQAESAFAPGKIEAGKARESYDKALGILQPSRGRGKAKEPYSYADAYKLATSAVGDETMRDEKGEKVPRSKAIDAEARRIMAQMNEAAGGQMQGSSRGPGLPFETQAPQQMAPPMQQPGARQPSQAQMRTQPGGMAQPMNGQGQAPAPAQAALAPQAPAQPAPRTAQEAGLAPEQASAMEEALFQAALSGKAPEGIEDLNSVPLDVRKRIAVRLAGEQKKAKAAGDAASSKRASRRENVGPNF